MTYSVGNLIVASDYNGFANDTVGANIAATVGTGTGNAGYGQSTPANVSVAATVTATQWAALNSAIALAGNHQGTTLTSRNNPVAGNTIAILANVNADITSCYTNRLNAVSSGTVYQTWSGNIAKLTGTGSGTSAWTITFRHDITFANASAARYFFNGGGLLKWKTNKSSTGQLADTEWNALASTVTGNIFISAGGNANIAGTTYTGTTKTGGSGTPTTLATTTGFYNLTTTAVSVYQQFSSVSPYTGQYIQVTANVNSNASPTVVTLTTTWVDPGGGSASSVITGGTDTASPFTAFGTAPATLVTYFPPETTYLANTWGTPTIAASIS